MPRTYVDDGLWHAHAELGYQFRGWQGFSFLYAIGFDVALNDRNSRLQSALAGFAANRGERPPDWMRVVVDSGQATGSTRIRAQIKAGERR